MRVEQKKLSGSVVRVEMKSDTKRVMMVVSFYKKHCFMVLTGKKVYLENLVNVFKLEKYCPNYNNAFDVSEVLFRSVKYVNDCDREIAIEKVKAVFGKLYP